MSADRTPTSRGITQLTDIRDGEGRDGGPELVIRGEHPVIAMPVLPRPGHEVSEPVEELKWGKLDDAVRSRSRRLAAATFTRHACGSAQQPLDLLNEDSRESGDGRRPIGEKTPQPLRHGDHPLPHGHRGNDAVDKVRGGLRPDPRDSLPACGAAVECSTHGGLTVYRPATCRRAASRISTATRLYSRLESGSTAHVPRTTPLK